MEDFSTPMMKQYSEIKKQYQDCLLFFRAGDFYELFLEDARVGAKVLDITLTSKAGGKDGRIPMAGVPYHAVASYLAKLVKAGFKVAICEQMSQPTKYGIVDREVVRIVTPGTVFDEKSLDKKENNYIVSVVFHEKQVGIAAADISTGHFFTNQISLENSEQTLIDELARLKPTECILSEKDYNNPEILHILKTQKDLNIYPFIESEYFSNNAQLILKKHFKVASVAAFGIENKEYACRASGVLLGYLKYTQKDKLNHIKRILPLISNNFMMLDKSTIINLELFSTIRDQEKQGSLIEILDETITAMGGRMLKEWVRKPMINKKQIIEKHNAVEQFLEKREERKHIRALLEKVSDIERLLSKLSVGVGNARDLVNLKTSLQESLGIKNVLENQKNSFINKTLQSISPKIKETVSIIQRIIVDEPPIETKEGRLIKKGVNKELDNLKSHVLNSKSWIEDFEIKEKKKTGITSLRVKFNQIFGFYIEISNSYLSRVPKNYMRKQTLVNGERFSTAELKEKEILILSAEEKINKMEFTLYTQVLKDVLEFTTEIQDTAASIAIIDCIFNFSTIADKYQYNKPKMTEDKKIIIKAGRHPVVENVLEKSQFVPNDVLLDHENHQLLVITGPNMAGKSVYIRQIALIVLLAQIGSFVPAESAEISVVDRVFVRSGASDVITSGLSTFMVEMTETAQILNNATKNSLIVMDEIGRGTSTYDGISIAWAVAEFLATKMKNGPKTLFATHYHELQNLEERFPLKILNYQMAIEQQDNVPIFLHCIVPGAASHSFGVAVARLAGVPDEVTENATKILKNLEERSQKKVEKDDISIEKSGALKTLVTSKNHNNIIKSLKNIDIHIMTPLEALNTLAELKNSIENS